MTDTRKTSLLTIGTLGSLMACASAEGEIITNTDLSLPGITLSQGDSSLFWDIDGANGNDAKIFTAGTKTNTAGKSLSFKYATGKTNAIGLVARYGNLINLSLGRNVGTALGTVNHGALAFVSTISAVFRGKNFSLAQGFTSGVTGYVGFYFKDSSSTILYGWAEVVFTTGDGYSLQIVQWAYDDTGAAITVGDIGVVPEPAQTAVGLGALALGAAGLRRWRKAKTAKAA